MNLVSTELHQKLADALRYSVSADRSYIAGKSAFWKLVGCGFAAFGVGFAVGIGLYGYSLVTRTSSNINDLSIALSKALSEVQLSGKAEGVVKIEPHEIALAKDQTILLDRDSTVALDPNAKIAVNGEINVEAPTVSLPPSAAIGAASPVPTIVNFTVFKSVPFEKGEVVTGWKFLTSSQRLPTSQYCYYTEKLDTSPLEPVVFIGGNEKFEKPKQWPRNLDVNAAFSKCVWFNRDG